MALFIVALPFNFIYSYLVARGLFPVLPGIVGLLTYGLLVTLVVLAPLDPKIWRRPFIVAAMLMLTYALGTALFYRFTFSTINPEVDVEIFAYHAINVTRSLTFLLIGIHLTNHARIGRVAVMAAVAMTLMVFANTDLAMKALKMPDIAELQGMYLLLGDNYAAVAIVALAYLRRSLSITLALGVSLLVLYLIGSRTSLYAFVPVACLCGLLLTRSMRQRFNRLFSLLFFTVVGVTGLVAPFVLSDGGEDRRLAIVSLGQDTSWAFRSWQMAEGLAVIWQNPFFGQYGSDYQLLNRNGDYIHSYLEIWRQFGLLPFMLFLVALVAAVRILWAARGRRHDPAWRTAVLLMVFSCIEITFARSWGSPYVFMAIGMAATFATAGRSAGRPPVPQRDLPISAGLTKRKVDP